MKKVRDSQASSIYFCMEMSKTQFLLVSIVNVLQHSVVFAAERELQESQK